MIPTSDSRASQRERRRREVQGLITGIPAFKDRSEHLLHVSAGHGGTGSSGRVELVAGLGLLAVDAAGLVTLVVDVCGGGEASQLCAVRCSGKDEGLTGGRGLSRRERFRKLVRLGLLQAQRGSLPGHRQCWRACRPARVLRRFACLHSTHESCQSPLLLLSELRLSDGVPVADLQVGVGRRLRQSSALVARQSRSM